MMNDERMNEFLFQTFLCNFALQNPKQLSQNAGATQTNFGLQIYKYSLEFSLGESSCYETGHSTSAWLYSLLISAES